MTSTVRGAAASAALLLMTGCGDGTLEPGPSAVARIDVGPAGQTLEVGDTLGLEGVARAADGAPVAGVVLSWMSENADIAAVAGQGATARVLAVSPGTVGIRASAGGRTGRVTLTVTPAPLAVDTVVLLGLAPAGEPQVALMEGGWEHVVWADVRVADGTSVNLPVTWSSSDGAVASVTPQGEDGGFALIRAHAAGRARIVASAGGRQGLAIVDVARKTPPASAVWLEFDSLLVELGRNPELRASVWDESGAWVADPQVTWFSHDTTVVEVQGGGRRGRLTGLREGRARVTASSGGRSATGVVRVKAPGPVAGVAVLPRSVGLWTGQAFRFGAHVSGPGGGDLPGEPVTWTAEDTAVVDVDATGLARGLRPGTTRVLAGSGARTGTADVRVLDFPRGPTALRLLPNVEPGGGPRATVTIGERPWTDAHGVARTAYLWLTGGSLTLDLDAGRWEQALVVETVVFGPGLPLTVLHRETRVDRGSVHPDLFTPGHYTLRSSVAPSRILPGHWAEGGLFSLRQTLGTAPALDYLYLM